MKICSEILTGTKNAWLWVLASNPCTVGWLEGQRANQDLYFSSPEKFNEIIGRELDDREALIKVWVPEDFDDWDYLPAEY